MTKNGAMMRKKIRGVIPIPFPWQKRGEPALTLVDYRHISYELCTWYVLLLERAIKELCLNLGVVL